VYTVAPKKGEGDKKKPKTSFSPLLPFWEKGLGDEGRYSICVRRVSRLI